ncbi:MAG: alpha/beta fold hydrolase [Candidatus Dormibacteraeota bacterium]|uniref:Alpha/beta fold hydrolase n=1 Tax=Candidatus Dormiibacter inghamiae TaxID=3127013 RepID=A0A934KGQ5_9BACT|nr:alpha/beta fold hydrolase [Candidatus Dormibacteraeota bacterium]MBJ7606459.1 alpha/beta fold hydrolase [Candidatus Dormibacteraeota bacterium]
MKDRSLASRLGALEPVSGLFVKMPAPAQVEMAGRAGFDFVLLDTEHGPGGGLELEHHLRAADAVGMPALVRVPSFDPGPILAALDGGARGVAVPHVIDGTTARAAVAAAHYPPLGRRGLALSTRAGGYGHVPLARHLEQAAAETLVFVQIEDAEAIDAAPGILTTTGVSGVLVGLNDLSISLGHPGDPEHPSVAAAVETIRATASAARVPVLVVVGSPAEARRWRSWGAAGIVFVAPQLTLAAFTSAVREDRASLTPQPPQAGPLAPSQVAAERLQLVLVPGMLCDADLWSEVSVRLSEWVRRRGARIDLDESVAAMAETVLASAPQRFALAGHSLGGIVCLEVIRRAPERVIGIALVNSSARPPDDQQLLQWERLHDEAEKGRFSQIAATQPDVLLPPARHSDRALRDRVEGMARSVGVEAFRRQLMAQRTRPDSRPWLAGIACPAIVIAGQDDDICPMAVQEELASGIAECRLERLAGCGHLAPLEQPEAVAERLLGWLSTLPQPSLPPSAAQFAGAGW